MDKKKYYIYLPFVFIVNVLVCLSNCFFIKSVSMNAFRSTQTRQVTICEDFSCIAREMNIPKSHSNNYQDGIEFNYVDTYLNNLSSTGSTVQELNILSSNKPGYVYIKKFRLITR